MGLSTAALSISKNNQWIMNKNKNKSVAQQQQQVCI